MLYTTHVEYKLKLKELFMSLKHGILGLLTYKSMTGYDLMKVFNESLAFFWKAQTSQIYRELGLIEKKGWVNSEIIQQSDKPNKKVFTLTDQGKKELIKWLDGHSPVKVMDFRDEMTMRVFFSATSDNEKLLEELIEYKSLNKFFYERLKKVELGLDIKSQYVEKTREKIYWLMAIKRGIINAQANINWVDECLILLEGKEEI